MMNVPRIIVGLLLFVGSAWLVPLISGMLNVGEALVFSTVGSVMACSPPSAASWRSPEG